MAKAARLFERGGFEAFVTALPATSVVRQWGDASVGKVGEKIFATFNDGTPPSVSFKCSEHSFELLTGLMGVQPAPYLARAKWVAVAADSALSPKEVAGYVTEAHRLVAAKLTRKARAELGLAEIMAAGRDRR
jgi:predicted DNA-binding protein (MmcQ/YjbR family)